MKFFHERSIKMKFYIMTKELNLNVVSKSVKVLDFFAGMESAVSQLPRTQQFMSYMIKLDYREMYLIFTILKGYF